MMRSRIVSRSRVTAIALALAIGSSTAALTSLAQTSTQKAKALRIVVLSGEDAVNIIQQKTAVAPLVEVRDENDIPVAGAAVTFTVGQNTATFAGGAQTITVTTNAAGRATAAGFTPVSNGAVQIQVSASFQGQVATATIAQTNVATVTSAASSSSGSAAGGGTAAGGGGGGLSTGVIAGIAAAGAAVAGTAVAVGGDDSPPAASPGPVLPGTFRGSFALTGNATFDGGCIIDEQYTVTNAEIAIAEDLRGSAVVPVVFVFTSRTPAICGNDTAATSYTFPITVNGSTFSSRLDFPLNVEPDGSVTGGFFTILSGELQGDVVTGTLQFERTGGRGGTGTVRGTYSLPRVR